ncbi:hypothetical protein [Paracoccus sp. SM22M-07]|uniref:hypothetical protein n=1 Tax=Paracoccus sp. SM22M-07 TaxID=1520813 RepID=UPI001114A237|nr:hypothetical protein [Paracoccus sp. SM22M-07]
MSLYPMDSVGVAQGRAATPPPPGDRTVAHDLGHDLGPDHQHCRIQFAKTVNVLLDPGQTLDFLGLLLQRDEGLVRQPAFHRPEQSMQQLGRLQLGQNGGMRDHQDGWTVMLRVVRLGAPPHRLKLGQRDASPITQIGIGDQQNLVAVGKADRIAGRLACSSAASPRGLKIALCFLRISLRMASASRSESACIVSARLR